MDVYIDMCSESLKGNKDFLDDGIDLDADENSRERLKGAFEAIFGTPPGSV